MSWRTGYAIHSLVHKANAGSNQSEIEVIIQLNRKTPKIVLHYLLKYDNAANLGQSCKKCAADSFKTMEEHVYSYFDIGSEGCPTKLKPYGATMPIDTPVIVYRYLI